MGPWDHTGLAPLITGFLQRIGDYNDCFIKIPPTDISRGPTWQAILYNMTTTKVGENGRIFLHFLTGIHRQ